MNRRKEKLNTKSNREGDEKQTHEKFLNAAFELRNLLPKSDILYQDEETLRLHLHRLDETRKMDAYMYVC